MVMHCEACAASVKRAVKKIPGTLCVPLKVAELMAKSTSPSFFQYSETNCFNGSLIEVQCSSNVVIQRLLRKDV